MTRSSSNAWNGPQWGLALLLAGLAMLLPFSIDTYLPAFKGIQHSLEATPVQLQQTLSAFLLGSGCMVLFQGALSDSFGRKRVILINLSVFFLSSIGCAVSKNIELLFLFRFIQGMSCCSGVIVGRAIIVDLFPKQQEAQRLMAQVGTFFGIAPAIAPILGAALYVHLGWYAIFLALALMAATLWLVVFFKLPETLPVEKRHSFHPLPLLKSYKTLAIDIRFLLLAVSIAFPFGGMLIYVLSSPVFLGKHLGFTPTQFFWLFLPVMFAGMVGSYISKHTARRFTILTQIIFGFTLANIASLFNIFYNNFYTLKPLFAIAPIVLVSFASAFIIPCLTAVTGCLFSKRKGMTSSMLGFIENLTLFFIAAFIVPLVMYSTAALAWASAALVFIGFTALIVFYFCLNGKQLIEVNFKENNL